MSFRRALKSLPDDRESITAIREVVSYLREHPDTPLTAGQVAHVTGVPEPKVALVFGALAREFMVDCDGDSQLKPCKFAPDISAALEVDRFIDATAGSVRTLQRGVDRFRGRYGSGRE